MNAANPARGEPTAFTTEAARLRTLATEFDSAGRIARALAADLSVTWSGQAGAIMHNNVAVMPDELAVFALWLEDDAAAHDRYAAALDELKSRQRALESSRTRVVDQLDQARVRLRRAEAMLDQLPPEAVTAQTQQAIHAAQQAVAALRQQLAALEQQWEELVRDRESLDRAFIATLESHAPQALLPPAGFGVEYSGAPARPYDIEGAELLGLGALSYAEQQMWLADHGGHAGLAQFHAELTDQIADGLEAHSGALESVIEHLEAGGETAVVITAAAGGAGLAAGAGAAAAAGKKLQKTTAVAAGADEPEYVSIAPYLPKPQGAQVDGQSPLTLSEAQEAMAEQQAAIDQIAEHLRETQEMNQSVIENLG